MFWIEILIIKMEQITVTVEIKNPLGLPPPWAVIFDKGCNSACLIT